MTDFNFIHNRCWFLCIIISSLLISAFNHRTPVEIHLFGFSGFLRESGKIPVKTYRFCTARFFFRCRCIRSKASVNFIGSFFCFHLKRRVENNILTHRFYSRCFRSHPASAIRAELISIIYFFSTVGTKHVCLQYLFSDLIQQFLFGIHPAGTGRIHIVTSESLRQFLIISMAHQGFFQ